MAIEDNPNAISQQLSLVRLLLGHVDEAADFSLTTQRGSQFKVDKCFSARLNLYFYSSLIGVNEPAQCKDSTWTREALLRSFILTRNDVENLDIDQMATCLERLPIEFQKDVVRSLHVYVGSADVI